MPANDGLRFDDNDGRAPVRPDTRELRPEEPISTTQARTLHRTLQDGQLLPQRKVPDGQLCTRDEYGSDNEAVILPGRMVVSASP